MANRDYKNTELEMASFEDYCKKTGCLLIFSLTDSSEPTKTLLIFYVQGSPEKVILFWSD